MRSVDVVGRLEREGFDPVLLQLERGIRDTLQRLAQSFDVALRESNTATTMSFMLNDLAVHTNKFFLKQVKLIPIIKQEQCIRTE